MDARSKSQKRLFYTFTKKGIRRVQGIISQVLFRPHTSRPISIHPPPPHRIICPQHAQIPQHSDTIPYNVELTTGYFVPCDGDFYDRDGLGLSDEEKFDVEHPGGDVHCGEEDLAGGTGEQLWNGHT